MEENDNKKSRPRATPSKNRGFARGKAGFSCPPPAPRAAAGSFSSLSLRQPAAFFSQAVGFFIPPIAGVGLDFLEAEGKVFGDLLGEGLIILC